MKSEDMITAVLIISDRDNFNQSNVFTSKNNCTSQRFMITIGKLVLQKGGS